MLVYDFNITEVECLKYALSKGLGFGIVVGGSTLKVPQVRSSMRRLLTPDREDSEHQVGTRLVPVCLCTFVTLFSTDELDS